MAAEYNGGAEAAQTLPDPDVADVADVQPNGDAISADTSPETADVSDVAGSPFHVLDQPGHLNGKPLVSGVHHVGKDKNDHDTSTWICSPLHIDAVTHDAHEGNYGRLLRFRNTSGNWRTWAMPMELLRGSGEELRGELLNMGVELAPGGQARNLLMTYLQARPPKRRMRCALQVGWDGQAFVLPDTVIGPDAGNVIFQSGECGHEEYTRAGTLEGWRETLAAKAPGNPLLGLALSAAFAGPLLAKCHQEGGGLHFVGDSSTGKTTLIEAACSVWGGPNYRRSWRATANGIEGAATLFNDGLMALDEISECDPREVGAIVYALGNGRGKQRASRTGTARSVTRWRTFILSSGERTISTSMLEGGYRAKAGQSVRLLDIPASGTHGAWNNLHGHATGAAFSDAIKTAAIIHHGLAGRAFLERLTKDTQDLAAHLEKLKKAPIFAATDGQHKRVAARFAVIALAGELATEYGITGWPEGLALDAAIHGFQAWLATRGEGNDERRQIIERVTDFIERHGDGRFSSIKSSDSDKMRDRAGWYRDETKGRVYLFTTEGLREALKGFDFAHALDHLTEAEMLPKAQANGEHSRSYHISGRSMRLYTITPKENAL
jgi:putative DNA primase/helicase